MTEEASPFIKDTDAMVHYRTVMHPSISKKNPQKQN